MHCHLKNLILILLSAQACGCALAPPSFDVPNNFRGAPMTKSITDRIRCELASMVRLDKKPLYENRKPLINYDYQVAMQLVLDVTDKAGLAPSLGFPNMNYVFNMSTNIDQSREDNLTINLTYSMRDIFYQVSDYPNEFECPDLETNLAGNLGLRERVSGALATSDLITTTDVSSEGGEFSGTINFITTMAITSAGPTWTFRNFTGPGEFASVSRVHNNKLSYGFATGKNANKPLDYKPRIAGNASQARTVLNQQIATDFGVQLSAIRNILRP